MKITILAAAAALLSPALLAQDFDLTDLTPARPGQSAPAGDAVTQGNVVVASDDETAIKAAHYQLVSDNEDGVRVLQVGSGTGILSIGSSSYEVYDNINATLLSKRAAYNQAYLMAKKQLIENFRGVDHLCETAAQVSIEQIDTGTESLGNTTSAMEEGCRESVQGSLAGYVTFDVFDDLENRTARVSLISTPKTRAQIRANAGAVFVSTDPNAIFKQVVADINSGVLPPVGAKVLTNPETGETIVIGYGSAIVRQNNNATIARKLKDVAKRQSQTRARSALLGTMKGEAVYWQGGFDESQVESSEQFEYVDPNLEDPLHVKKLDQDRALFVNQLKASDEYGSISQGQLPPGVKTRSFLSEDGYWQYTVAVYAPSLEATARRAAAETRGSASASGSTKVDPYGGQNNGAINPRGASGQVSDETSL